MPDEAIKKRNPTQFSNIAHEHYHFETGHPIAILKHDGMVCPASTSQDLIHLPFKSDGLPHVLAIIIQRDDTDVGVSSSLFAASCNTDNLRVQT
jgi:hypothetical protein